MASGLNVAHQKTSTVQILTPEGLNSIVSTVITIAEAEGLQAHSDSVNIRLKRVIRWRSAQTSRPESHTNRDVRLELMKMSAGSGIPRFQAVGTSEISGNLLCES